MKDVKVIDEKLGIYTYDFFQHMVSLEKFRAKRYSRNLSIIIVYTNILEQVGSINYENTHKELAHFILRFGRRCDFVAPFGDDSFIIALPETSKWGSRQLAQRLEEAIEDKFSITVNFHLSGSYPTSNLNSKVEDYTATSKEELINIVTDLKSKAFKDTLTGLYNRRFMLQALQLEIERYNRYNTTFSVMILDLNDFKILNDTLGHAEGDKALKRLAKCLKATCRKSNIITRYGGDEFVIILPETKALSAMFLRTRIINQVTKVANLKCCIGIATINKDNIDSLLDEADKNLYEEKKNK